MQLMQTVQPKSGGETQQKVKMNFGGVTMRNPFGCCLRDLFPCQQGKYPCRQVLNDTRKLWEHDESMNKNKGKWKKIIQEETINKEIRQ